MSSVDSENAKRSGIQKGDMIYYIGDTQITDAETLLNAVKKYEIGDEAEIVVIRGNDTINLTLKVSEKTN